MVLPPVVGGVALLLAFGRNGLVGQWLDRWFGITLPFTTAGVILAETFVAMPFLVITVEAALRSLDTALRGRGGDTRRRPVDRLPPGDAAAIAPSLAAGARCTWARALGEFGATITFAGNFQGVTQTMPLAVYLALETEPGVGDRAQPRAARGVVAVLAVVGRPRVRRPPDRRDLT